MNELAIDIGSSYCTAVIRLDNHVIPVPFGTSGATRMPSACWIAPDGTILVGDAALQHMWDEAGTFVRNVKSLVGRQRPIVADDRQVRPADVLTATFAEIGRAAAEVTQTRGAPERGGAVILTCPATWATPRRSFLVGAAQVAFGGPIGIVSTARAAAAELLAHASLGDPEDTERFLVYDLGGGSLDVTVLGPRAATQRAMRDATPQLGAGTSNAAGGDLFDALLLRWVVGRQPELAAVRRLDSEEVVRHRILLDGALTRAREALSTQKATRLDIPQLGLDTRIYREELDELLAQAVKDTVAIALRALSNAQVKPVDVRAVLLAGGASRTPAVTAALWEAFDTQPLTVEDPNLAATRGALVLHDRHLVEFPAEAGAWPAADRQRVEILTSDAAAPPDVLDSAVPIPARPNTTRSQSPRLLRGQRFTIGSHPISSAPSPVRPTPRRKRRALISTGCFAVLTAILILMLNWGYIGGYIDAWRAGPNARYDAAESDLNRDWPIYLACKQALGYAPDSRQHKEGNNKILNCGGGKVSGAMTTSFLNSLVYGNDKLGGYFGVCDTYSVHVGHYYEHVDTTPVRTEGACP